MSRQEILDEQTAGDIIAILKKLAKERQNVSSSSPTVRKWQRPPDVVLELSRRSLVEKSK